MCVPCVCQLARDGDVEITKKYLQYMTGNIKKKVNVHDDEDVSPVHYAARYNHVQIVKLLVEAGASKYRITSMV